MRKQKIFMMMNLAVLSFNVLHAGPTDEEAKVEVKKFTTTPDAQTAQNTLPIVSKMTESEKGQFLEDKKQFLALKQQFLQKEKDFLEKTEQQSVQKEAAFREKMRRRQLELMKKWGKPDGIGSGQALTGNDQNNDKSEYEMGQKTNQSFLSPKETNSLLKNSALAHGFTPQFTDDGLSSLGQKINSTVVPATSVPDKILYTIESLLKTDIVVFPQYMPAMNFHDLGHLTINPMQDNAMPTNTSNHPVSRELIVYLENLERLREYLESLEIRK